MRAAFCGTDVHIYMGDAGSARVTPPVILGHEFSGIVEAVGERVTTVKAGDHVSVDPNLYCGQCQYCRIGKKHLCEHLQATGVTSDGGFAEYCVCTEDQCFVLNSDIPLEFGALAEPVACCLHGIDKANIRSGDTVCIVGGGAVGLIMIQLAKMAGASQVVLSEPVEMRRKVALELGADAVIDPVADDLFDKIRAITHVDGADVVIECAGNIHAVDQAFRATRRGATVVLFSVPRPNIKYEMLLMEVYSKELTIHGSFINPDTHQRAINLINSNRINLKPLITHRFPLPKIKEAIESQMSDSSIKVLVVP